VNESERPAGRLDRIEDAVLALLLGALILLSCIQIALRNLFGAGVDWIGPCVRYLVFWLGLLGALAAARRGQHIAIDAVSLVLGPRARAALAAATAAFAALVCALVAQQGARLVALDREAGTLAFAALPAWCFEVAIPFCFGAMALCYAWRSAASLRRSLARDPV
jgi:TRAP-type C4-dicarboxylate transport system permease small subunit